MRISAIASLLLLAALPAFAAPVVTKIDVPGASVTYATAISPSGIVAGAYAPGHGDACGLRCGFLRMPDGTFTTFSVFGAYNVGLSAVLDDGTSAGSYRKGHNDRGFIRAPDGTLTDIFFREEDATVKGLTATGIVALNVAGPSRADAFLRLPDGTFKIIKVRGCTFTGLIGINAAGTVAGYCLHKSKSRAYLRALDGTVTIVQHAGWKNIGISAIDDTGAVSGIYTDKATGNRHGFIRNASGGFRSFELPGDNPISTYIVAMAVLSGDRQVVGWLGAHDQRNYGFIHHSDGTDEVFDVSDAHGAQSGTLVSGISPSGTIVGYTFDDGVTGVHGFIRTP